jgi:hypothetical protein
MSGHYTNEKYVKTNFPELYSDLVVFDYPDNFTFSQKLYHYLHDDLNFELGKCEQCGSRCQYKSFSKGYYRFCSNTCKNNSQSVKDKISKTRNDWSDEKKEEFSKKMSDIKLNMTDDEKEVAQLKRQQTCLDLYGVSFIGQTDKVRNSKGEPNIEKTKQTLISKYGSLQNYYTQYGQKISQSYSSKTDDEKQLIKEKRKQTNLDKYGTECQLNNEDIRSSYMETIISKYGSLENYYINCAQKRSDTFSNKSKEEKQQHRNKIEKTNLDKYGTECYFQTKDFQEKSKQTCINKYGVDHYTKSDEYHKSKKHRFVSDITHETFDSTWERKVAEFCFVNHINYIYQPDIHFEYEFNNKVHIYKPDFLIEGKLYEVKGNHFFDGDKMINPYDRNQDGLYEAKHQCMLRNEVIILTSTEIEKINFINTI